ncbi:MAG TPA: DUF2062 domain-containing protein [Thermoanaerobaculia bacterium]|nr:DUF2062 domain-containing protein [Thermoanaerobaculia bacterium]
MSQENRLHGESTTQKRRRSLKRRWVQLLVQLMGRAETPERVAAAVALGVGVGLSPFIGFHFILAIVLAFCFRLNKLDTVLGSFAGNPWTLPPVYALGYRLGRAVLGFAPARVPPLQWQRILHHDFWVSFRGPGLSPRLASFLLGTSLLAAAAGLGTYLAARGFLKLYHRRHPRIAARAARRREVATGSLRAPTESEIRPDDRVH